MIQAVKKPEFENEVLKKKGISVVKFSVDWSGACQIFEPIYEELSQSYNSTINFYTIDADEERTLTNEYGVRELPTILFFSDGKMVDYCAGMISRNAFTAKLENAINQNKN